MLKMNKEGMKYLYISALEVVKHSMWFKTASMMKLYKNNKYSSMCNGTQLFKSGQSRFK